MIQVGLVGNGGIAGGHLSAYARLENAQLIALCDKIPERARGEGRTVPINIATGETAPLRVKRSYTDYREFVCDPEIEVVDICLPSDLHAPVAIAALEAGKHVLCEKPMALNVADCDRMIAAAEANDRKLMIAQVIRFAPEYLFVKQIVERGTYGKLLSADFRRISSLPLWTSENWMADPRRGGGCTMDLHIHDVDFINFLLGVPTAVNARGVVEDYGTSKITAEYRYGDGTVIFADSAWFRPQGVAFRMNFIIYLEGAVIDYHGSLTVHPLDGEQYSPEMTTVDGMTAEIAYFLDCVAHDTYPEHAAPRSTRETIRMALAAEESIRTGGVVSLEARV